MTPEESETISRALFGGHNVVVMLSSPQNYTQTQHPRLFLVGFFSFGNDQTIYRIYVLFLVLLSPCLNGHSPDLYESH